MGSSLKHVRQGDPLTISASDFNAMIDAARAHKDRTAPTGSAIPSSGQRRDSQIVSVMNATGSDHPRHGVLGIDGPIITPTDNPDEFARRVTINGVVPTTDHVGNGRFVILLEPALSGNIARAYAGGVYPAKINITDESITTADAVDGDATKLTTVAGGPLTILWAEPGTGDKMGIVRFGGAGGSSGPSVTFFRFLADVSQDHITAEQLAFDSGVLAPVGDGQGGYITKTLTRHANWPPISHEVGDVIPAQFMGMTTGTPAEEVWMMVYEPLPSRDTWDAYNVLQMNSSGYIVADYPRAH